MEISVKTLDSNTHIFKNLEEEITVLDFKSHISETVCLEPQQQRLIFRGRVLQDDKKLKDYNISSGQVIHLVVRNPATSSTANDQPQQPQSNNLGSTGTGASGRNNTIFMGTIGTLEFPNSGGSGSRPAAVTTRRTNAAAVRLSVASRCLTRASDTLRRLEEEASIFNVNQETSRREDGGGDDEMFENGVLDAIGRHHAATAAAAVVASIQRPQPHVQLQPPSSESSQDRPSTPIPRMESDAPTATENISTNPRGSIRVEPPMLREMATVLFDVLAFNARLRPFLQTIQRWLAENPNFEDNTQRAQFAFNSISQIMHSVSHTLHALSDVQVDFSTAPSQRRLRAPPSVWVEQSPVIRATIPIGVRVGGGEPPQSIPVTRPSSQTNGGATGQNQGGNTPPVGMAGLQHAISNLIQGVMSGPAQSQAGSTQGTGPVPIVNPMNMFGNNGPRFASTGNNESGHMPIPGTFMNSASNNSNNNNEGQRSPMRGTENPLAGLFPGQGRQPRLENMILQCQSHHYAQNNLPTPPEGLRAFIAEETNVPISEGAQILDNVFSLLQGLNVIQPALCQYLRGTILRGRDPTNSDHVTSAIKPYARRISNWIVENIRSSSSREVNTEELGTRLTDIFSNFLSRAAQAILTIQSGDPITPALSSLVNEYMPMLLSALENTFAEEHQRVFKGILLLAVTMCFPSSSLVFTTQLTAALSEYLIKCQQAPEVEVHHVASSEISMEIDVEIEEMMPGLRGHGDNVSFQGNISTTPSSTTTNPTNTQEGSAVESNQACSLESIENEARRFLEENVVDDEDEDFYDVSETAQRPCFHYDASEEIQNVFGENFEDADEFQPSPEQFLRGMPPAWYSIAMRDFERQRQLRETNNHQEFSEGFHRIFPRRKE